MTDSLKHFALGALGGLGGLAAMGLYWKTVQAFSGQDPRTQTKDTPPDELDEISVTGEQEHKPGESSTAAAGRIAHEAVTGSTPSKDKKATLSSRIHQGYGLTAAGVYGLMRGPVDDLDAEGGLAMGLGLWALGDELAVPLLGLSRGPTAFPLRQHVHRLGAHLSYGLATAATTQVLLHLTNTRPRTLAWNAASSVGKTYLKWKLGKRVVAAARRAFSD
jgi:hypothetical protein